MICHTPYNKENQDLELAFYQATLIGGAGIFFINRPLSEKILKIGPPQKPKKPQN